MSNEVVSARELPQQSMRMNVSDVVSHAKAVQEVMTSLMKRDVHYGAIPGAGDKPTLLKPGAETLCMAFRIADEYKIEDLGNSDVIRYRITCTGIHQTAGIVLGSGVGEASSNEDKYRWRKAVCKEEFEATPENMRRIKFGRKQGGFYTAEQVRTDPADIANTILKMAVKRAKIAMVLNVTAASDMFSQDMEDLDEALRQHLAEKESHGDPALRDELVMNAANAATKDALSKVWATGVKVLREANDVPAYNAFKDAVGARGKELSEVQP